MMYIHTAEHAEDIRNLTIPPFYIWHRIQRDNSLTTCFTFVYCNNRNSNIENKSKHHNHYPEIRLTKLYCQATSDFMLSSENTIGFMREKCCLLINGLCIVLWYIHYRFTDIESNREIEHKKCLFPNWSRWYICQIDSLFAIEYGLTVL